MSEVTTGDDNEREPGEPVTDFDYVTGALAYAIVEELTLDDLESILPMAHTGPEFDAAVVATIWLKDCVEEYYESI